MLKTAGRTVLKITRACALQVNRYYYPLCDRHFRIFLGTFLRGETDRRPQIRCKNDSFLWLALQSTFANSSSPLLENLS